MVQLQTYQPKLLARMVHSIWFMEVPSDASTDLYETIIPDGHQEIIIHTQPQFAFRADEKKVWIAEPLCFFLGQTTASYEIKLKAGASLYGIRFHPHTLPLFFPVVAAELTDILLPADAFPSANFLVRLIDEVPQVTFHNIESHLVEILNSKQLNTNKFLYTDSAINFLSQANGSVNVNTLCTKLGISLKYLNQLFSSNVGVTPKSFNLIRQLQEFIRCKNTATHKSLTECCYESGFTIRHT